MPIFSLPLLAAASAGLTSAAPAVGAGAAAAGAGAAGAGLGALGGEAGALAAPAALATAAPTAVGGGGGILGGLLGGKGGGGGLLAELLKSLIPSATIGVGKGSSRGVLQFGGRGGADRQLIQQLMSMMQPRQRRRGGATATPTTKVGSGQLGLGGRVGVRPLGAPQGLAPPIEDAEEESRPAYSYVNTALDLSKFFK